MVWSAEEAAGDTVAIITVRDFLFVNESFSTSVNFEARYGTCEEFESNARMHSFNANRDLLISAPSMRR